MNKLDRKRQIQVVAALVEGNSIRATVRMTGAAKGTVLKLLVDLGAACEQYQDKALRGLSCKRIQCDEIWSFCYAKQKNVPKRFKKQAGFGDMWTWTALCPDTKLVPTWLVGPRSPRAARVFIDDLAGQLTRPRATHDGRPQGLSRSGRGSVRRATLTTPC